MFETVKIENIEGNRNKVTILKTFNNMFRERVSLANVNALSTKQIDIQGYQFKIIDNFVVKSGDEHYVFGFSR